MAKTPEESTCWGSVLAGFIVGALTGATLGLLIAPKSGRETRAALAERLEDVKARIDETTRALTTAAKAQLHETGADLSQAVQEGRAAARARAEELRRQVGM